MINNFLNKLAYKNEEEFLKAKEDNFIKAFDFPVWFLKAGKFVSFFLKIYLKIFRYKIIYKRNSTEFWHGKKLKAEIEMVSFFKPGKFKKY